MENMKTFLIIGSHHMARSWAILLTRKGCDVTLYIDGGTQKKTFVDHCKQLIEKEKEPDDELSNLEIIENLEDVRSEFDYILDCSLETLSKRREFYLDNTILSDSTIICISDWRHISSEVVTDEALQQRILGVNAVIPPHVKSCIEICPTKKTTKAVTDQVVTLMRELGQVPLLIKREVPGLVAARLEIGLLQECFRLVKGGVITFHEVEKCMVHGIGMRYALMGCFQTEHLTTLKGLAQTIISYRHIITATSEDFGPPTQLNKDIITGVKDMLESRSNEVEIDQRRVWLNNGMKFWRNIRDS